MRKLFLNVSFVLIFMPQVANCGLVVSSHNDTKTYTPLMATALGCDLQEAQKDVAMNPAQMNVRDTDMADATALHDAVSQDCSDVTQFLLDHGAEIDAIKTDGLTSLHLAARRGNIEIIKILLDGHANINAVANDGGTPLKSAITHHRPEAAQLLKDRGGKLGNKFQK